MSWARPPIHDAKTTPWRALSAVPLVFLGCCTNVILLEFMVKKDPGCGNLITFLQFLFISVEGFIFEAKCGTKAPIIPLKEYLIMVSMYFLTSVINNYVYQFDISIPLHTIFRSGSLLANMILGMIILRRRYTLTKKMSVAMVSVGIAICSLASGRDMMNRTTNQLLSGGFTPFFWWCVGVAMLTVSLFLAARLGIFQETLYQKYGKHPRESLFYSHAIPLFGFFFAWKDISNHMGIFNNSEPLCIFSVCLPSLWWGLLGNIATQYLCIRAVYFLTTEFSSLSVTLINTLRKFVSLVISIVYFQNVFTTAHWAGTILVFGGTLLFVDVFGQLRLREKRVA